MRTKVQEIKTLEVDDESFHTGTLVGFEGSTIAGLRG